MTGPPDGCPIFRPVAPNQGLATLLLIENSQEMVPMWPDLRDRHLPTLIGAMRLANPVAEVWLIFRVFGFTHLGPLPDKDLDADEFTCR
jgi:hypothetical protein